MPLGRRKVPFSSKQKKVQLKEKRERKREQTENAENCKVSSSDSRYDAALHREGRRDHQKRKNRYDLCFLRETSEELAEQKLMAHKPLKLVEEKDLEMASDSIFPVNAELDFPKRPIWNYNMSRAQVEEQESKYFQEYVSHLAERFTDNLSYFELNLETWRQLWRVLEMADIVLIIVDIRFPLLQFPPSLYSYIVNDMKKSVILVLNKIDMAPTPLVQAWTSHLKEIYPEIQLVYFSSYPIIHANVDSVLGLKHRRRQQFMAAESLRQLLAICKTLVKNSVDLTSWAQKIEEEAAASANDENIKIAPSIEKLDATYKEHVKFGDGILTISCIGYPNVGKSSVINALMGRKVVSVSRTPGHTKHFQTIFLTPTVKLCDCPGLVFPSVIPKPLQILSGSYPIAQVRAPYAAVKYLAERVPLPPLLKLVNVESSSEEVIWTAWKICDAWASKRGFKTAKAARNDTYRAANNILRMALDGRICLCLRPPNYSENLEIWKNHSDLHEIKKIQEKPQNVVMPEYEAIQSEISDETDSDRESNESAEDADSETDDKEEFVYSNNKYDCLNQSNT